MRQFQKIFSFTFLQHIQTNVYRNVTVIGMLLCLLLPAVIMPLVEYLSEDENYVSKLEKVYVADMDAEHPADYSILNSVSAEEFQNLEYIPAQSAEEAVELADKENYAAVLIVEQSEGQYQMNVLRPENSELEKKDVTAYEAFLYEYFRVILVEKSGLDAQQIAELTVPVEVSVREYSQNAVDGGTNESDEFASMRKIFAQILPYLNIMILYFMVLAYGQGTANSTIMEKTSKLMDLFLVTVKPGNMLLGKVFAMTLCGIMQLGLWIAALVGGFAVGTYLVKMINPDTTMALLQLFEGFGQMSGMFTLWGIISAVVMLAAGFLLYCSLAAIGGALAGKPEDLSSTNMVFVMALIISFFATMYAGGVGSDLPWESSAISWQIWVPFTSILVMPTRMLLGWASAAEAAGSVGVVVLTAVLLTLFAGKLYKIMSLYKGNPPGPKKILEMMKSER